MRDTAIGFFDAAAGIFRDFTVGFHPTSK